MKLSPLERDDIRADIRAFVNSPAYVILFDELERNYIGALKSANVGDLQAATAHASLRVLEDVKAQINIIATQRK